MTRPTTVAWGMRIKPSLVVRDRGWVWYLYSGRSSFEKKSFYWSPSFFRYWFILMLFFFSICSIPFVISMLSYTLGIYRWCSQEKPMYSLTYLGIYFFLLLQRRVTGGGWISLFWLWLFQSYEKAMNSGSQLMFWLWSSQFWYVLHVFSSDKYKNDKGRFISWSSLCCGDDCHMCS